MRHAISRIGRSTDAFRGPSVKKIGARLVVAAAGLALPAAVLFSSPVSAGPASAQDEAAFLSWVHRFASAMGVVGTDAELLSDGYYTCHLRALGQSPAAQGISDLITTHAFSYLCPAYDR